MSEAVAQQTDVKANKRPKFVRQLSKSYEKGKEVMKRNLLTPRGPRTAKSAELPLPDAKAEKDTNTISQVPKSIRFMVSAIQHPTPGHFPALLLATAPGLVLALDLRIVQRYFRSISPA
jgi:hypothetical protein